MRVRIYRYGKTQRRHYVECFHLNQWHDWNDQPLTRRQAERLAAFLRADEAG